jgi:hypothetical protein
MPDVLDPETIDPSAIDWEKEAQGAGATITPTPRAPEQINWEKEAKEAGATITPTPTSQPRQAQPARNIDWEKEAKDAGATITESVYGGPQLGFGTPPQPQPALRIPGGLAHPGPSAQQPSGPPPLDASSITPGFAAKLRGGSQQPTAQPVAAPAQPSPAPVPPPVNVPPYQPGDIYAGPQLGKITPPQAPAQITPAPLEPGLQRTSSGPSLPPLYGGIPQAISNYMGESPRLDVQLARAKGVLTGGLAEAMTPPPADAPPAEHVVFAIRQMAAGQATPYEVGKMLLWGLGGKGIALLQNSNRIGALLQAISGLDKAMDVASRAAIPAYFAVTGGKGVYEEDVARRQAWERGDVGGATQAATREAVNAVMSLLGAYGVKEAWQVRGAYPPEMTPAEQAEAAKAGGIATPTGTRRAGVTPEQAGATAEQLRQQGAGLAAQAWAKLDTSRATPLNIGGKKAFLSDVWSGGRPGKGDLYQFVFDEQGNDLMAGSPDAVRGWLDQQSIAGVRGRRSGTAAAGIPGTTYEPLEEGRILTGTQQMWRTGAPLSAPAPEAGVPEAGVPEAGAPIPPQVDLSGVPGKGGGGAPAAGPEAPSVPPIPGRVGATVAGAPAPAPAQEEKRKPIWEMTRDEIEQLHEDTRARDQQDLVDLFGEEGAKRYQQLDRAQSSLDFQKANKAAEELTRMEAGLNGEQLRRLYGQDLPPGTPNLDEIKDYRDALRGIDPTSAADLGKSLQWAITRVGYDPDPARMDPDQRIAYATIREAYRVAQERGFDPAEVSRAALTAAWGRYPDPEDAEFMLEQFLRPAQQQAQQPKPEAAQPPAIPPPVGQAPQPQAQPASQIPPPVGQAQPSEQYVPPEAEPEPELEPARSSRYADLAPHDINLDPVRLQFKQEGIGQKGVTDQFKDVTTWDPNLAGTVHVWRDPADGKIYVVNGHHRVELAQRLVERYGPQAVPEGLHARFLDAKTVSEARAQGALINIAEGNGTPLDIAKYFRDSGKTPEETVAAGAVTLKKRNAQLGAGLSKLAQPIFDDVVAGALPVERAAIIGANVPNHLDQRNLYDLLKARERAGRRMTDAQLQELIRLNESGPTKTEVSSQGGLFGEEEMQRSLLPEKAEVSEYVRKQLAAEKKLFGAVGTQAAAERLEQQGNIIKTEENAQAAERASQGIYIYDQLSRVAGLIDQHLNQAAQEIADGQDPNEVKRRAYTAIRQEVQGAAARFAGRPQGAGSPEAGGGEPEGVYSQRRRDTRSGQLFHEPGGLAPEQPAGAERVTGQEVARHPGLEKGTAAVIARTADGGHAVQLIDTDDGMPLGPASHHLTRAAAEAHAQDLAQQQGIGGKAAMRQMQELVQAVEAEKERHAQEREAEEKRLSWPQFGAPAKPTRLKPAQQSGLFEEGPEQEGLFARRVSPLQIPKKRKLIDVQRILHGQTEKHAIKESAPDAVKLHRLVNKSRKDLEAQLARDARGMNWYADDTALSDQDMEHAFEELAHNRRKRVFFKMISAAISPGLNPKQEAHQAAVIYAIYRKKGTLPLVRPSGQPWSGRGVRVAMRKLNRLAGLMGEEQVVHFLEGHHDAGTIRAVGRSLGVSDPTINKWIGGRTRMLGAAVLGPKVGRYFAGITGLPEDGTAIDLWMSRMHYRQWGHLIQNGKAASMPRTPAEHKLMMQAHEILAEEFGLTPKQVQSLLWHNEQELYRSLGATARTYRRSEGTLKYLEENGFAKTYVRERRAAGSGERAVPGEGAGEGRGAEADDARAVPGSPKAAGRQEGQEPVASVWDYGRGRKFGRQPGPGQASFAFEEPHDVTSEDAKQALADQATGRPKRHLFSLDPNTVMRLEDPPRPSVASAASSQQYFDAADGYVQDAGGVPAIYMNAPMMDTFLYGRGTWRPDRASLHVLGSAVTPWQWKKILQEEIGAYARTVGGGQPKTIDQAMIALGDHIRLALGLPTLQEQLQGVVGMTGHAGLRQIESEWSRPDYQRQFIVAQVGKGIPSQQIKETMEEEYDHIQHYRLPEGLRSLPVHITETSWVARAAARNLAETLGYPELLPAGVADPTGNNAAITSEILVRLMRPGRWRDFRISAQETGLLALQYINGLASLGEHANAIIDQINDALPDEAEIHLAPGSQAGVRPSERVGEIGARGPPGAATGTGEDVSRLQEPEATLESLAPVRKAAEKAALAAKGTVIGRALGIGPTIERQWVPRIDQAEKAVDDFLRIFSPASRGPAARRTGYSLRAHGAHMDRVIKQAGREVAQFRPLFNLMPQNARWKFIIRAEAKRPQVALTLKSGRVVPAAELDQIAATLNKVNDFIRKEVEDADDPGVQRIWRENYWPNMWKETSGGNAGTPSRPAVPGLGRAPLAGPKSFQKKKVFNDFLEGVNQGYTPKFDNPIDYWNVKIREMAKFAMANRLRRDLKPMAVFLPFGQRVPDGYAKINDAMGRVYQYSQTEKGMIHRGDWVFPAMAADMINNHLSPDPRQTSPALKLIADLSNAALRWKLTGWYHLGTTGLNAIYSHAALGLRMVAAGDMKGAAKQLAVAVPSFATDVPRGRKLMRDFLDMNGGANAMFQALEEGGFRAGQDPMYASGYRDKLREAWEAGERFMPLKGLGALSETLMSPIMEHYVPYLKMAAASDIARFELEQYQKKNGGMSPTPPRLRKMMADAVDSVDNRFGQLTYDNLFWKRMVKALLMVNIMSIGWNLGTMRELLGGGKDILFSRGSVTNRIAYLVAMNPIHALWAATYQKLMTGKNPESVKDLVFPRDGGYDERGHETRVSAPDYAKEEWNWMNQPADTALNKAHPFPSFLLKLVNNRDYWGSKIRNKDDDYAEQIGQLGHYIWTQEMAPLSLTNLNKMLQRGEQSWGKLAASQLGFSPTPSWIGLSKAEKLLADYMRERQPVGGRDIQEAQRTTARGAILRAMRTGADEQPAIENAMRQGLITGKDIAKMRKVSHLSPLQSAMSHDMLDPGQVLHIWEVATPDEREEIQRFVRLRLAHAAVRPGAVWSDSAREAALKYFGIRARPRLAIPPTTSLPPPVSTGQY